MMGISTVDQFYKMSNEGIVALASYQPSQEDPALVVGYYTGSVALARWMGWTEPADLLEVLQNESRPRQRSVQVLNLLTGEPQSINPYSLWDEVYVIAMRGGLFADAYADGGRCWHRQQGRLFLGEASGAHFIGPGKDADQDPWSLRAEDVLRSDERGIVTPAVEDWLANDGERRLVINDANLERFEQFDAKSA